MSDELTTHRKLHSKARKRARRLRRQIVEALGAACACCGESHFAILTIDHIQPLKGKRRRPRIYQHLLALGCPQDANYQVLCLNCNMLKGTGAECLHQTEGRGRSAAA